MRKLFSFQRGTNLGLRFFVFLIVIIFISLIQLTETAQSAVGDITLTASSFSDTDAEDTFQASQWVIRDASNTVYDQTAGAVTTITVPAATFTGGTTYFWKVRYQDQHLVWSDYSTEGSFVYPGVAEPSVTSSSSSTSTSTATITPTPSPSATSTTVTPTPTPTSTSTCSFGWQDWDHDGVADDCGDPKNNKDSVYVPGDQILYCPM